MKKPHGKQVTRKISLSREADHWLALQPMGASAWVAAKVAEAVAAEQAQNQDEVGRALGEAFGVGGGT